jgi:hypothetical protein
MTLQEAITALATLMPKAAGQLIKPTDWNLLVDSVASIGFASQQYQISNDVRVTQLETQTTGLRTDLDGVIDQLADVRQAVASLQPLLDQYVVTMRSDRIRYAMGEICELTALVTDLSGNPVAEAPWVDFVCSWGRLRPKAGFESRAGVGDNSISVRTNASGVAQVLLRADHTEGFTDAEEVQISTALTAQVPAANATIAMTLLNANTPTESFSKSAYQALNVEYDRTDSIAMRSFVDTYFVRTPEWLSKPARPNILGNWRDYRATVMAFAKPDADPTTPDSTRGGSTIQITFRDWISHWIKDYVADLGGLVATYTPQIGPALNLPYQAAVTNMKDLVENNVRDKGIVGRVKHYDGIKLAIDSVVGANSQQQMLIKEQVKNAVSMQGSSDVAQMIYSVSSQQSIGLPVMQAMIGVQSQSAEVGNNVQVLSQQVAGQQKVADSVAALEGRMQRTENLGSSIGSHLTLIGENVRAINAFDQTSIQSGVNKINAEIALIRDRIGT